MTPRLSARLGPTPLFDREAVRSSVPTAHLPSACGELGQGRVARGAPRSGLAFRRLAVAVGLAAFGTTLVLLAGPPAAAAQPPCPRVRAADLQAAIDAGSARTGVPQHWIAAVIAHESAGFPCAVSTKGAMGLMQLMPATWATLRADLSLGSSPFDVSDNVLAGATYLRRLYDRFGLVGMLGAYSAGPGRYAEAQATGRPLPPETVAYIAALAPRLGSDGTVGAAVTAGAHAPQDAIFAQVAVMALNNGGTPVTPQAHDDDLFFAVTAPAGAP